MKRPVKIFLFLLTSLALISWDRGTKEFAKEHLMNKEPLSYFHNTIRLEYVENTGAAMSMGDDLPKAASLWLFSIIPLLILSGVFVYAIKRSNQLSVSKLTAIALIFSGGVGNIIDRLLYDRHVADFMNVGINNFRTGIFNFADMCVTAGVVLFAIYYFRDQNIQTVPGKTDLS